MKSSWNRIRMAGALLAVTTSLTLAATAGARIVPAPPMPPNDEAPPRLTLELSPASIAEGGKAVLVGWLARPLAEDLAVDLWLAGDAGPDDFDLEAATLYFPAGETEAMLRIVVLKDLAIEGTESLVVGSDDPAVVLAGKATLAITDAPARAATRRLGGGAAGSCPTAPGVRLEASSKAVVEGGGAERLTLRLSAPACEHLSFPIEVDRIPVPADLELSAASFEVPAGALASEVEVRGLDDAQDEPLEQFVVRVQPLPGSDQDISVPLFVEDDDADVALGDLVAVTETVAGGRAQFQIEATNPGFKDLVHVAMVEAPVEGLTDVHWRCVGRGGAECPGSGDGFALLTASMPARSSIVVVIDALVEPSRRAPLEHRISIALVEGSLSDPDPSDNEVTATHKVDVVADLALDLEVAPWDPKGSDPALAYTLVVRNLGPSDAAGGEVTSPLADHLVWAGGDESCGADGAAVSCVIGALPAGETRPLEMVLSVLAPYPAFTIQEAWLDPSDPDPFPKNDEAVVETKLDLFVPTLDEVVATGGTGSESLGACSQLVEAPVRLQMRFSEEMIGGGAAGDVDSVESYRLYAPGPDGDFEISACGIGASDFPGSDDVEIPLLAARWNPESATVEIDVAGLGVGALDGLRRLIACESLRDFGDNTIDGDGDGNPGDAAIRPFRVDRGNLVRNGHFDCDLDGWSALAPKPEDWTLGADASGSSASASSRIDNSAAWPAVGLGTCVPIPGGSRFDLRLRHRLSSIKTGSDELAAAPIVTAEVDVACTPYSTANCTGEAVTAIRDSAGSEMASAIPEPAGWTAVALTLELPNDTVGSLLCTVSAAGEYEPFVLEVDDVRLRAGDPGAGPSLAGAGPGRPVAID
jgi:hypothetical protein